ncbi:PPE family protein [Saccharothrix australiensis]|uniref:PPE-repeat protein n=1 Tax=Saccharothrix australiensis TaxID=2072 RepID=A0A495VVQ1_9PSEU|nr:PPE domain-containing protein [Saccharothrix australiensis]RKT53452.1 PPE-repeat protein [Saccharothrix australiensis]
MSIKDYNFDAQSHQQLYQRIHGGPGYAAAQAVEDAWNTFRAVMGNAKADLESAVRDAGAVWIGAAGEQFTGSAAPLVQWAEDARTAGVETHNAFSAQASYYGSAKTTMPEPVQVTSTANDDYWGIPAGFTHLVGGQTDQDVQEQQANEAKREAVRVMNSYRDGAASAVDALGTFDPPPQVVTQVSEPTFQQSEAHPRYTPQLHDGHTADTTSTQRQQHQTAQPPAATPPAVAPLGDDTRTSTAHPPTDVAPRPTPAPVPPPVGAPAPPPFGGPYPTPIGKPVPPHRTQPPGRGPITRPPGDKARGSRGPGGIGGLPLGPTKGGSPTGGTPRFGEGRPVSGQPSAPGGSTGITPDAPANRGAGTPATNPVRGAPPGITPMAAGMAGAPQRGRGEDDVEHKSAPYLEELADVWGEDGPRVAPPVIGEDDR